MKVAQILPKFVLSFHPNGIFPNKFRGINIDVILIFNNKFCALNGKTDRQRAVYNPTFDSTDFS